MCVLGEIKPGNLFLQYSNTCFGKIYGNHNVTTRVGEQGMGLGMGNILIIMTTAMIIKIASFLNIMIITSSHNIVRY